MTQKGENDRIGDLHEWQLQTLHDFKNDQRHQKAVNELISDEKKTIVEYKMTIIALGLDNRGKLMFEVDLRASTWLPSDTR